MQTSLWSGALAENQWMGYIIQSCNCIVHQIESGYLKLDVLFNIEINLTTPGLERYGVIIIISIYTRKIYYCLT